MFKKKYHGIKMVVLFLFVLLSLVVFSTTCYALTPVSDFTKEDLVKILEWCNESNENYVYDGSNYISSINNILNNETTLQTVYNGIYSRLNGYVPYLENITIVNVGSNIYFFKNNNTIDSNLPLLKVVETFNSPRYALTISYINDSYSDLSINTFGLTVSNATFFANNYNNRASFNNTTIVKDSTNDIANFMSIGNINIPGSYYTKLYGSSTYNWLQSDSFSTIKLVEDIQPSGDDGGGTVIPSGDNSGESGGNIDYIPILGDINNNISNQGTAIINNQNENTDKIVNAVSNANENYWGSSGDLTGENQEDYISSQINNLVDDISGDLSSNSVFQHLDSAENIFLDFFKNKQNEEYYDLIINWDAISPVITMFNGSVTVSSGQSIVSGDSINISALCRDNPEFGKIQQYIRIIFNFGCLIALLWQIYNLVLSTLGIDNPYLYEDAQVTDVVNSDTGEVRSYYRTHKRFYRKR